MIDYRTARNKFRSLLIKDTEVEGREDNLLTEDQFASEGISFNATAIDIYVEEITGIDNDTLEYSHSSLSTFTITYNVRGQLNASEIIQKTIEDLRLAIADLFEALEPFTLNGQGIFIKEVKRRPATNNNGWRLAPLDVTVEAVVRT